MTIDLGGRWGFRMDEGRRGLMEKWYEQDFTDRIPIPGTMEEAGYGFIPEEVNVKDLNHTRFYRGWAWYQTDFTLTAGEASRHVALIMDRIQWDSRVWVDAHPFGAVTSLAAPHEYDLTGLTPGRHRLVVLVDNSNMKGGAADDEPVGQDALGRDLSLHLRSAGGEKRLACGIHLDHYAWNGIVGSVRLEIRPRVRIDRTEIYPDIEKKTVRAFVHIANDLNETGEAALRVSCGQGKSEAAFALTGDGEQVVELTLELGEGMRLWDEFDPYIYTFDTTLQYDGAIDTDRVRCGLRALRADGRHILINGRRLFLRATLEGTAFPYTAYTPTDEAFWLRAYTILKEYGLNGMRMHSFVPPRAAFEAAEQAGFYLQIELPGTSCPSKDEDPAITEFLWHELRETLRLYGNYACFIFMSMGNEQLVSHDKAFLARHQALLMEKVAYGQRTDPRHMYTCTSHPHTDGRNDDFYVVATKDELVMNGIRWGGPDPITTSRFSLLPPSTDVNYQEGVERIDAPVITHEVGQWAVYPDFSEMPKYTGVLKPRNYEVFARELDRNGLLHQNAAFVKASGELSLRLYKEEIESALRTPDLSGFELLDIHDYPGQGTSPVGLLNVFFESKGIVSADEMRHICAPRVALCSFDRYAYTSGETITLTPMVANYGRDDLSARGRLRVVTAEGYALMDETFPVNAPAGGLTELEKRTALLAAGRAAKAKVIFEAGEISNSWDIWIYPAHLDEAEGGPAVVRTPDEAMPLLDEGKDVLIILSQDAPINGLPGSVTTQFWNPFMKPQKTLNGLMLNPSHPMLADFPTDGHTDWQWWEILKKARFIDMSAFPKAYFPLVQAVPGIGDNKKWGLIWEGRAGKGRYVVCAADLPACEGPAAKQLMYSIRRYMTGGSFDPKWTFDTADLTRTTAL